MTKSAVKAMDTITAFLATEAGGATKVDKFVVAGGSKRGWTTWTTAAVDKRVVAISPMVIDLLNIVPSFIHHYRAYGFNYQRPSQENSRRKEKGTTGGQKGDGVQNPEAGLLPSDEPPPPSG